MRELSADGTGLTNQIRKSSADLSFIRENCQLTDLYQPTREKLLSADSTGLTNQIKENGQLTSQYQPFIREHCQLTELQKSTRAKLLSADYTGLTNQIRCRKVQSTFLALTG